ncbi:MAG TPA: hypothetical protein VN445_05855 [Rectinemataceae bacterium]|nr:hypothetical protein [Rectinemataceae bacterium]
MKKYPRRASIAVGFLFWLVSFRFLPAGLGAQGQTQELGLGAGLSSGRPQAAANVNDLSKGGSTWRHPIGFSFWYPSTFTLKEAEGSVQLVPVSLGDQTSNKLPELYFLTAESIRGSGIVSPFDVRVIGYLDNLVTTKISPYLARKAQPASVPMAGGEGLFVEWQAAGQGDTTVVARIYATVLGEFGVFLVAVGDAQALEGRGEDLTAVLRSITLGEGKLDQGIAGIWKLYSTRQLRNEDTLNFTVDDPRRADMVSDEQTSLQLGPDGSARRVSLWRTIARGGAAGGNSTIWLDSGEQKSEKRGRWNAESGTIVIMWENGDLEQWQYALVGGSLKLAGSGKVQFWQR